MKPTPAVMLSNRANVATIVTGWQHKLTVKSGVDNSLALQFMALLLKRQAKDCKTGFVVVVVSDKTAVPESLSKADSNSLGRAMNDAFVQH